jgi:hypothetical protein
MAAPGNPHTTTAYHPEERDPGALPFDYFAGRAATQAWIPVPGAARAAFPTVADIVAHRVVRRR